MSANEAANPLAPPIPPGEDELPYSDGEPLESETHREQMQLLIETLNAHWATRDDFYCGGNMFVYFSETQVRHNDFRGPDVFVVLDTTRRVRKSWVVWQEERTPDVVIELLSASTEHRDRGEKMRIYERVLKVGHYFLYDPVSGALEGYRLRDRSYEPIEEDDGLLEASSLGLSLGVWRGAHHGVEGDWLRWYEDGEPIPTPEERAATAAARAEAEAARAEAEAARAEAETARADAERTRADRLEEQLAAYRTKFGDLD